MLVGKSAAVFAAAALLGLGCVAGNMGARGAQQQTRGREGPVRLVILADDMGASHGFNVATIAAHDGGVITSTNVIVPGAWFLEAAHLAKQNPELDFGIHLALTSEWEFMKWRPLTHGKTLTDPDGYFPPRVRGRVRGKEGDAPGPSVEGLNPDLAEVEDELRAQIELGRKHIPRVSYLWEHMGFTSYSTEVDALVSRLGHEYGIPRLLDVMKDLAITYVKRPYDEEDSADAKATKLAARIRDLQPGIWLMVDHAATDTPEIQAIGHPPGSVARDRSTNVIMWSHPAVKDAITQRGVELTSVANLVAHWRNRTP